MSAIEGLQASMLDRTTAVPDQKIIFVLGALGAGKGTLCGKLVEQFDYCHISLGDHLRALCNPDSGYPIEALGGLPLGRLQADIKGRKVLEAGPILGILKYRIEQEKKNGRQTFVINGFPRADNSAVEFEAEVGKPTMVLVFDCARETAKARFLARKREAGDNSEMFARRYAEFERNDQMSVDRYGQLVKWVSKILERQGKRIRLIGLWVDTSRSIDGSYKSLIECLGRKELRRECAMLTMV
ncbi:bifunctional uridylate/adenylate kinase [Vermiconidia calcicola]|uniref:Bifunctional uridylate/adenylate kinase n=1 Tax=Vermiconidia calcicola TaxID=1690605 RepID=A0ACC3NZ98_9PEZI|nr:bifunctional uridylate/adenylate kinase [Vermiconidia calcicola]